MTFEGQTKVLPIKGIERAGADNLCEDGAMNEVVGLEYKDGSYVPYAGHEEEVVLPLNTIKTYSHKTSLSINDIAIDNNGAIYWKSDNAWSKIDEISGVKEIEFIGNMLCASTDNQIYYYLFESNKGIYQYTKQDIDYSSLPTVSFRVTAGFNNKNIENKDIAMFGKYETFENEPNKLLDSTYIKDKLIAAFSAAASAGGFTGYFLVTYAYRLKNNSFVYASVPTLMYCPHFNGDFEKNNNPYASPYNEALYVNQTINKKGVYYGNHKSDYVKNRLTGDKINYPQAVVISQQYNTSAYDCWRERCAYVTTNKLQYKISGTIDKNNSLIESLCIFISPQIDPYRDFDTYDDNLITVSYDGLVSGSGLWLANSIPVKKSNADIYDEVKKIKNMYLIHEIQLSAIEESSDWKNDIQLNDILPNDSLVQQERLPIESFYDTTNMGGRLFSYNNRLHLFNYKSKANKRVWFDIVKYYKAEDQKEFTSNEATLSKWQEKNYTYIIRVNRTTTTGVKEEAYKFTANGVLGISGVIYYPTTDVDSFVIEEYGSLGSTSYTKREFKQTAVKNIELNMSVASVASDFTGRIGVKDYTLFPTNIALAIRTETVNAIPDVSAQESIETSYKNYVKVSDTAYPTYFPIKQTYSIGDGEIVGMASLSTALSQDTFGSYPVLVFCTDGIYAMNVDTSGELAYSNISSPFSREVCVNRNTICEIDGAVLFASDKGLMIATGISANNVQPFCLHLNGEPNHLPQTTLNMGNGLKYYRDIINHAQTTELTNSVSTDDFIEYLQNSNTVVSYVSTKNKIIVYNKNYNYVYWIDISTRIVTKLASRIFFDNDDYPTEKYIEDVTASGSGQAYKSQEFGYLSANRITDTDNNPIDCMFQTRPIKINQGLKSTFRCFLKGEFYSAQYKTGTAGTTTQEDEDADFDESALEKSSTSSSMQYRMHYNAYTSSNISLVNPHTTQGLTAKLIISGDDNPIEVYTNENCHFNSLYDNKFVLHYKVFSSDNGTTNFTEVFRRTFTTKYVDENTLLLDIKKFKSVININPNKYYVAQYSIDATDLILISDSSEYLPEIVESNYNESVDIDVVDSKSLPVTKQNNIATVNNYITTEFTDEDVDLIELDTVNKTFSVPSQYGTPTAVQVDGVSKISISLNTAQAKELIVSGADTTINQQGSVLGRAYYRILDSNNNIIAQIASEIGTFITSDGSTAIKFAFSNNRTSAVVKSGTYKCVYVIDAKISYSGAGDFEVNSSEYLMFENSFDIILYQHTESGLTISEENATYDDDIDNSSLKGDTISTSPIGVSTHTFTNHRIGLPFDETNEKLSIVEGSDVFTIPSGMSSLLSMKFTDGDEGWEFYIESDVNNGNTKTCADITSVGHAYLKIINTQTNSVVDTIDMGVMTITQITESSSSYYKEAYASISEGVRNVILGSGTYRVVIEFTATLTNDSAELGIKRIGTDTGGIEYNFVLVSSDGEIVPTTNYGVTSQGDSYSINNLFKYTTPSTIQTISNYAELFVLGSIDGKHWQVAGCKEKELCVEGFKDLGCTVERSTYNYFMVLFSASLNPESHIDAIELSEIGKYNNKLKS